MSGQLKKENKRIIQNTFLLYFRMLFISLVSLYTVRVTINILGNDNYGIFNVVSSIVGTLIFLTSSMTSATQRFFSFQLGKKDKNGYNNVFNLLLLIFFIISVFILILGYSIGDWFVESFLVIPQDRIFAAKYIYKFSLITFILNFISVPFTASIISYEKMNVFAYISIIDGLLKLLLVYLLVNINFDQLVGYGLFIMIESLIIFCLYTGYCLFKIDNCTIKIYWNSNLFKELFSYTGWNLLGSISGMLNTHGQNIMLNLFFGPIVNAAKAISDRVNALIFSFSSNFYLAVSPQIIKKYASNEKNRVEELAFKSSKYGFFLLFILAIPFICNAEEILTLWLGEVNVTMVTIQFVQLTLIYSLVLVLETPLTQMIRATGEIKYYQISVGLITLLFIPISYLFLKMSYPPQTTMYILIIIYIIAHIVRLAWIKKQYTISINKYIKDVLFPIIRISVTSFILSYFIMLLINTDYVILTIIIRILLILLQSAIVIYWLGLNKEEKRFIDNYLISKYTSLSKVLRIYNT